MRRIYCASVNRLIKLPDMHSILFVVLEQEAKASSQEKQNWLDCCKRLKDAGKNNAKIQILAQNVLLIPAKNGLPDLADVLKAALDFQQQYKVLFFEKEPEWVQSA